MVNLKFQKPAKRYAQALFEVIDNYDAALDCLDIFLKTIDDNAELKKFLIHPVIKNEDKKDVVKEIFKDFDKKIIDFLLLVIDENRLNCLYEIRNFLQEKINAKNNVMIMDVTLAIEPSLDLKEMIKNELESKFKKKISINFIKNENIIGGMLIKKGDTLIDLSIKSRIENFKRI